MLAKVVFANVLGKDQHLLLGQWLRQRYSRLLSSIYKPDDIYVVSIDVDRTLMSAETNLAGMYPPVGNQVWDVKDWMPIPVHTVPEKDDNLLSGKKYCERYPRELRKVMDSSEWKKIVEDNADLTNKTLPACTKAVYPDILKYLAGMSFEITAYNKILLWLKSGPLLKDITNHMELYSKNELRPNRKLWVYSAHDFTITNLVMTLGVFEPHCPVLAATLLIELRIDARDDYVVTIFYKNSTGEPSLLTFPGCVAACPLHRFVKLTKDVIPVNWERDCSVGLEEESDDEAMILSAIAFLMLWFTVLILWLSIHAN